jgi:signal transduction histidine kinase
MSDPQPQSQPAAAAAADSAAPDPDLRAPPRATQTEPGRILLVEDDDDLREVLRDVLVDHGHDVHLAGDGEAALRLLGELLPDLVILDLMMPSMDGWQFRVQQKQSSRLAGIPVMAISASRSPTAAAVDAEVFLHKPFEASALLAAVDQILTASRRRASGAKAAHTERMASLGTLAAGVAHEINNPLTYVLLHLGQALRLVPELATGVRGPAPAQLEQLLRGAIEGAERIRGITRGVQLFSRSDDLDPSPVDLTVALDSALRLVDHELRHRAKLVREGKGPIWVMGNEARLGQVFLNLLTNAVQAIPEGKPDEQHEVRVSCRREAREAVVEISDTGAGVAPHLIGRIFEPFFSTKPVGQGTGLGLSISHGIIRGLGGEISVLPGESRGSVFTVRLPLGDSRRPETPPPAPGRVVPARRAVLVIDDDAAVARAVANALSNEHEVTVAGDANAGLDLIANRAFDVILCDLQMPGISGVEFYEELLEEQPEAAKKVIFMTGGVFSESVRSFLTRSKVISLDKPLDLERLRGLVAAAGEHE